MRGRRERYLGVCHDVGKDWWLEWPHINLGTSNSVDAWDEVVNASRKALCFHILKDRETDGLEKAWGEEASVRVSVARTKLPWGQECSCCC